MKNKANIRQLFMQLLQVMVLLLCGIFSSLATADRISLWIGLDTYHVDRENDEANNEQNEINALFYNRWIFSSFINSYSRRSELIGYQLWHWPNETEKFYYHYGVAVAAATGYGRELASNIDGVVTLGVSPYLGGQYKFNARWSSGLDIMYLPTDNGGVFVWGLNLSYRF